MEILAYRASQFIPRTHTRVQAAAARLLAGATSLEPRQDAAASNTHRARARTQSRRGSCTSGVTSAGGLSSMHTDVCEHVFSYCDVYTLMAVSTTCKAWHAELRDRVAAARIALRSMAFDMEGALARLVSMGMLQPDVWSVARFLYDSAGRVPPAVVGRYITAPRDVASEEQWDRGDALMTAYLANFDFSQDTLAQALRRMLARTRLPFSHTMSGRLLKRLCARYLECQRGGADASPQAHMPSVTPSTPSSGASEPVPLLGVAADPDAIVDAIEAASASSSSADVAAHSQQHPPRLVHGFDVANSDRDTLYVLMYCCIILNTDMRSAAIKQKMTREAFSDSNRGIPSLAHVPASFFRATYDEIAVNGLPVNDRVPTTPVRHAMAGEPPAETVRVLRPLVRSHSEAMRETAVSAFSWLRSAVNSLRSPPRTSFMPTSVAVLSAQS